MEHSLSDLQVKTVKVEDAAKILGTSPQRVKAAILNGTLPIGAVFTKSKPTEVDRVTIIESRLRAWLEACDLKRG